MKNKKAYLPARQGFTLIEMIVSMALFSAVALISTGTLLILSNAQKKAFSLRSVYDSIRFSLEIMAKDIRTGVAFHCGSTLPLTDPLDCPTGGTSMTYTNSAGRQVTYQLFNGRIEKVIAGSLVGAITPPEVTIDALDFYVVGAPATDQLHPRVTIVVVGRAGTGKSASQFNLQTTITQRKVF